MATQPLISICIPAFKRIDFLKRLLESIAAQTFRDFEVVLTDDSPDGSVQELSRKYEGLFPLRYFRNARPLGTPENWNEGIRRSQGQWIKIMHDDDWFVGEGSLQTFADWISGHPDAIFFFCAYRDVFLDESRTREMWLPPRRFKAFLKNRTILFGKNIIGAPSVTLYKKQGDIFFDNKLKWVVDIDFYIRYLHVAEPVYIPRILVNIGLGSQQVTQDCFRQRPVEIPENFYLLNRVGWGNLRNILVYDAWWRMIRNLELSHERQLRESGYSGEVPAPVLSMIRFQRLLSNRIWKIGPVSKTGMFLNYLFNLNAIGE